jgi:hypothetical protein
MASYYTSQAYDVPSADIWSILTDFQAWPHWFPGVSRISSPAGAASPGTELIAYGDDASIWTKWLIEDCDAPTRLVCQHVGSNAPMTSQVRAAYLKFGLVDDPEGCTLEVELGAQGRGVIGDFFVGVTLASGVRRMLPDLIDAFSDYVVRRLSAA